MKNKIVLIFATLLAAFIIIGLVTVPSVAKADNTDNVTSLTDFVKIYRQALVSPLIKAKSDIKDPMIASFYGKLIQSFNLENSTNTDGPYDESNLANLVPNLLQIEKAAIDMPLKEAGNQLKDKDLSDFYKSFISSIGVSN